MRGGCFEKANLRLAAMAMAAQRRDLRLRMMQAVEYAVNMRSHRMNSREHSSVKPLQHFGLQVPFGNPRLVGDDDNGQAEVIQQADCFRDTREKTKLRAGERRVNHPCILMVDQSVDYAIAIKKYGSAAHRSCSRSLHRRSRVSIDPSKLSRLRADSPLSARRHRTSSPCRANIRADPFQPEQAFSRCRRSP